MSLIYTKFIFSWNATTTTSTIAAIATITTTTTTTLPTAVNISESLREEAMDVVVAKIISLLILTILSVLSGLLPLRLLIHTPHLFTRSRASVDYFLCGLRLFSGGIYLATCFLHLMPDTRDKMAAVMLNMGSRTTYAVPELLVMSGFYAVVFVEQIIQALYVKAQKSDMKRKRKKANKPKPDTEAKRPVQIFRSTLDEDVGHGGNHGDGDRKIFSDDEEDDDDDDNVLIDDEDDLSFNDTDSDPRSVDSATQVKENLIDQIPSRAVNQRCVHLQSFPSHSHPSNDRTSHQEQELPSHSKPCSYSEAGTLKATSRLQLESLSKASPCDSRAYQNSGPPVIHTHAQQHSPQHLSKQLSSLHQHNHHIHFHQQPRQPQHQQQPQHIHHSQHQQQQQHEQQQHPHDKPFTTSPPNLTGQQQQQQQQPATTVQQSSPQNSPLSKVGPKYPCISQRSHDESDEDSDVGLPNNTCRVSVCVEGGRPSSIGGGSSVTHTAEGNPDRDVDSGVFSTRREADLTESEPRKFTQSTSRDVSFDRISESSSVLPDIQVKRVVDELSRTDDTSTAHFRSIIYIMALSFHGIFEGMALGLQSMKSSVWALCFAIVVHRCVLAFKLGMDLCRGEEKQGTTFLCIGTFTLISTLGIIIGILISSGASLYSDVTVPEAILQSLATGTIFYIVFFDILFKDLEGKDDLKRVSSSFVGFSLMAIVFAITRS